MYVLPEDPGSRFVKDKAFGTSPFQEAIIAILEAKDKEDYCISSIYDVLVLEKKFIENEDYEALPSNECTLQKYYPLLGEDETN